ncbi:microfibril-associated glycoprotein 4-like [Drosophila novamexicana]|uniref:microfibril-associated glycoprotein 4-like n=1 Tax=Drosophila novamexicana TaxID=47314 RepID=UPI0011E5EDEE|nr:microfibril-associated glycoprotein 4-like [Drosophila novamexicana]
MKSVLFSYMLYLCLMFILGETQASENEATTITEEQCGKYFYKAVSPLLKDIHQMKEEIENNNNKIEGKDREIKQLQEKLNQRNDLVIEELRAQNEFYKQSIKELASHVLSINEQISIPNSNALKTQDYEEQLEKQKKSIDQQAQQIPELKNEINICAKKLKRCEEKPVYGECTDFADAPGIHEMKPDLEDSFDVLCDSATAGPGWTVIQQRINGKEDFYRDWATYREGFGAFDGDFFLGLEKIHRLTRVQPHELYIHMEEFDGNTKYRRYDQFAISGEEDQYTLITLGKSNGSAAGDQLEYHKDKKFSTFDRDNDNWESVHCASRDNRGGGWWYGACTYSNLNGKYYDHQVFNYDAIYWKGLTNLKTVKMLIRPISNGK